MKKTLSAFASVVSIAFAAPAMAQIEDATAFVSKVHQITYLSGIDGSGALVTSVVEHGDYLMKDKKGQCYHKKVEFMGMQEFEVKGVKLQFPNTKTLVMPASCSTTPTPF
jgi:hypothetical protein